jgi:hypothetical protein
MALSRHRQLRRTCPLLGESRHIAACLLLRSLLGVKRTWLVAAHMSARDPKRTSNLISVRKGFATGRPDATARYAALFRKGLNKTGYAKESNVPGRVVPLIEGSIR